MHAILDLPTWAQLALAVVGLASAMGVLYIAAVSAAHYTELHEFKVNVITLRNQHLRRLKALYSGYDPDGDASSIFGDPDKDSMVPPPEAEPADAAGPEQTKRAA